MVIKDYRAQLNIYVLSCRVERATIRLALPNTVSIIFFAISLVLSRNWINNSAEVDVRFFVNVVLFDLRDIESDIASGIITIPAYVVRNKTKNLLPLVNSTLLISALCIYRRAPLFKCGRLSRFHAARNLPEHYFRASHQNRV